MLSPEQMKLRERVITASQVSTILGFNPYSTARELAKRKMEGMVDEDRPAIEGKMDVRDRGHVLERPTAEGVVKMLGYDPGMLKPPGEVFKILGLEAKFIDDTLFHKQRQWLAATIDFLLFNPETGEVIESVEVKSSSSGAGWSPGQVPPHVNMQCQVQMLVLNSHGFNVKRTLVAGCISSNLLYRWVEYNPQAVEPHLRALYRFQTACNKGDESYFFTKKRRERPTPISEFPREEQDLMDLFLRLKQQRRDVDKQLKEVSPRIQRILTGHTGAEIPGKGRLSYNKPSRSLGTDTEKLIGMLEGKLIELGQADYAAQCHRDCVKATGRRGHVKFLAAKRKK